MIENVPIVNKTILVKGHVFGQHYCISYSGHIYKQLFLFQVHYITSVSGLYYSQDTPIIQ